MKRAFSVFVWVSLVILRVSNTNAVDSALSHEIASTSEEIVSRICENSPKKASAIPTIACEKAYIQIADNTFAVVQIMSDSATDCSRCTLIVTTWRLTNNDQTVAGYFIDHQRNGLTRPTKSSPDLIPTFEDTIKLTTEPRGILNPENLLKLVSESRINELNRRYLSLLQTIHTALLIGTDSGEQET